MFTYDRLTEWCLVRMCLSGFSRALSRRKTIILAYLQVKISTYICFNNGLFFVLSSYLLVVLVLGRHMKTTFSEQRHFLFFKSHSTAVGNRYNKRYN